MLNFIPLKNASLFRLFLAISLLFSHVSSVSAAEVAPIVEAPVVPIQDGAGQLPFDQVMEKFQPLNIDGADLQAVIQKIMNEYLNGVVEKRKKMLALLPEHLQEMIRDSSKCYESLVESVNIGNNLILICDKIATKLPELVASGLISDEQHMLIAKELGKFHLALVTGAFTDLLRGVSKNDSNPLLATPMSMETFIPAMTGMPQPMFTPQPDTMQLLTDADVQVMLDLMSGLSASIQTAPEQAEIVAPVMLVQAVFAGIKAKNSQAITDAFFIYLKPLMESASEKLRLTIEALDAEISTLPELTKLELKKALMFQSREIQQNRTSLKVFLSLKSSSEHTNHHNLFKLIAYSYDICNDFLGYYLRDNRLRQWYEPQIITPVLADYAFKSSMAVWQFFNLRSDLTKGVLFNTMLGNNKISSMGAMQLTMYNALVVPMVLPVLFKPSFWYKRPPILMESYSKIVTSWIYYQLFHCYLFGQGLNEGWPKDYQHIRTAVMFALKTTNKVFFDLVHSKIRQNSNPILLENIHYYSWGTIKPEMLGFVADTVLPVLFKQKVPGVSDIINATDEDLFGPGFDRYYQHVYGGNPDVSIEGMYIEQRVISYFMSSIGHHWGGIIANKYQSHIGKGIDWVLGFFTDTLEILHLLGSKEAEAFHEIKDEILLEIKENITMIKTILSGIFVPENPFRKLVIPLLVEHGYVDKDEQDQELVNKQIMYFALTILSKYGIISHLESATLLRKYISNPEAIDEVLSDLVDALPRNAINFAGGAVGSSVMTGLGSAISWHYGPFYPKIKRLFSPAP